MLDQEFYSTFPEEREVLLQDGLLYQIHRFELIKDKDQNYYKIILAKYF
jgi:hypothetical protein